MITINNSLTIVNIVATANLSQVVDQVRASNLPYCRFDPVVYRCLYVASPRMKSSVSVFATGKMISAGTKEEHHAQRDLEFVARYLAKAGLVKPRRLDVKIQNIVATIKSQNRIDLEEIALKVPHIIYEPEQFPGAIYHPTDPIGLSILIFASGKAVIAGAKNAYELRLASMEFQRLSDAFKSETLPRVDLVVTGAPAS
jgi:transcription initiation factor TFIID TATA-box-binding protein